MLQFSSTATSKFRIVLTLFTCGVYTLLCVQEYGLLPRGYVETTPSGRGGRGERLTEDQRKELRQMRKRQRMEHRKRKILRLDDEGVRGR